jgi:hypothetical protein
MNSSYPYFDWNLWPMFLVSECIGILTVLYAIIIEVEDCIPCEICFIKETRTKCGCSLETQRCIFGYVFFETLSVFYNLVTYTHFFQRCFFHIAHTHLWYKGVRIGGNKYLLPHLMVYVITLEPAVKCGNFDSARIDFFFAVLWQVLKRKFWFQWVLSH